MKYRERAYDAYDAVVRNGEMSIRQVAEEIDAPVASVRDWLVKLEDAGHLQVSVFGRMLLYTPGRVPMPPRGPATGQQYDMLQLARACADAGLTPAIAPTADGLGRVWVPHPFLPTDRAWVDSPCDLDAVLADAAHVAQHEGQAHAA